MRGPAQVEDLARVYALVGEYTAAIDELERLLDLPNFFFSVNVLERDPTWDPLRTHPQYRELLDARRH